MTQVVGRNSSIIIWDNIGASQNLSGNMNNVVLTSTRDNPETTTLSKDTKQRLANIKDATLVGTSIWNGGASNLDSVLSGIFSASQNTLVQFVPGGILSGCAMYSAYMQLQNYSVTSPINGVVAASYTFQKSKSGYTDKLLNLLGSSLIAYWPLGEPVGTTGTGSVKDVSGNIRNATPTSTTFGAVGINDGLTSATFDAVNSYIKFDGVSFDAAINGNLFSLSAWVKARAASVWSDATTRGFWDILSTSGDKSECLVFGDGSINAYFVHAGFTTIKVQTGFSSTAWNHFACCIDVVNSKFSFYINGALVGTDVLDTNNAWTGTVNQGDIGSDGEPFRVWDGSVAHFAVVNRYLTAAEVLALSTI